MAPETSVVVVDNASEDGTLGQISNARIIVNSCNIANSSIIANSNNRGFAAAVNQGAPTMKQSAGDSDFLLLLNPDTILLTSLDTLVAASKQHGIAGGKLVDENKRPQEGFTIRRLPTAASLVFEVLGVNRLWPSSPVNRYYRYWGRDLEQAGPAEQPAGAFLMVRGDVWQQLGGMDEQFGPVWFEDVDLCRRAADAGLTVHYVPQAIAQHAGGHSVRKIPAGRRAFHWYASLLKYSRKHLRPFEFKGVCLAVMLGSVPRMFVAAIQERTLRPITDYMQILANATQALFSRILSESDRRKS